MNLLRLLPLLAAGALSAATVSTFAGNGQKGYSGDGGPATAASMNDPFGVVRGPDGAIWYCEYGGQRIRRVDKDGTVSLIAGNGQKGYSGDGGPAKDAAKAYTPGPIGVISRSGGMTTEMSSTLTAAGLGQSTAVSIGGDAIIGSTYAELMPLFEADEQTQGIVIYTEPGGRMEAQLAQWVTENNSRLPIVAFMAGRFMDEMPGMSFGHAGTIVEGKEDTATEKIARLAEAGITVAEEISEIPALIQAKIDERGS